VKTTKSARKKNIENKKRAIVEYLSQCSCEDCGEADPLVLEFTRSVVIPYNPRLRRKAPKKSGNGIYDLVQSDCNMEKLQQEMKSCSVVCSNCASRRDHRNDQSYRWKYLRKSA